MCPARRALLSKQMGVAVFLLVRYKYPGARPALLGFPGIVGVEIKVQTRGASGSSQGWPGHCSDPTLAGAGRTGVEWALRSEAEALGRGGRCCFPASSLWIPGKSHHLCEPLFPCPCDGDDKLGRGKCCRLRVAAWTLGTLTQWTLGKCSLPWSDVLGSV